MQPTWTKEYNTSNECMGNMSHCELVMRLKFNLATKLYMHKPESILENVK